MPIPVRSLRLQKRSSKSLDTLSGASGEIFFDSDRGTLRLYTANQADSVVLADRVWVAENTFSGNYSDLINPPFIPTDVSELSDSGNTLFSGDYNDLANAPDLDNLNIDITTIDNVGDVDTSTNPLQVGQLLEWDGTNWVNTTVAGFTDTNTLYDFEAATNVNGGIYLNLTDSDAVVDQVEVVGGAGITIALNISGQVEVQNTASYAINDLSDVNISNQSVNDVLAWDGGQWISSSSAGGSGGIALTDLSVTTEPEGTAALSYDQGTGQFTYTPPDLSSYASLTGFSVTLGTAQSAGNLSYNDSTGVFTFNPANLSGYSQLTDFSITTNAANAGGSLSYNNTSGEFIFEPADLSGISADLINDTTPQLGGTLDLNTNDITGAGDINITGAGTFTGTVTANDFAVGVAGAPAITSASTITLTAPDGVIFDGAPIREISELMVNDGTAVSGTRTFDVSASPIKYITGITANITVNFTNVPTTNDVSHSFSVVVDQGTTAFIINAIQIGGAAQTILWADGVAPSGTNSGTDVFTFTLLRRSAAWTVLGSATSYS